MRLFPTSRRTTKSARIAKDRLRYVLSRERSFERPPIDARPVCFEETPRGPAIALSGAEWSSVLMDVIDQLQQADSRVFSPNTQVYLEAQSWVISPAQAEELRQILAAYGLELVSESLSQTPSSYDADLDLFSAGEFDPGVIQSTTDFSPSTPRVVDPVDDSDTGTRAPFRKPAHPFGMLPGKSGYPIPEPAVTSNSADVGIAQQEGWPTTGTFPRRSNAKYLVDIFSRSRNSQAQVARVKNGEIVIEPWFG